MAAFVKVGSRGQITLPHELRHKLGIAPGTRVFIRATGQDTIEIRIIPPLMVDDLIDRYPIEEPVDEVADREAWQAEAAKDVIGQ